MMTAIIALSAVLLAALIQLKNLRHGTNRAIRELNDRISDAQRIANAAGESAESAHNRLARMTAVEISAQAIVESVADDHYTIVFANANGFQDGKRKPLRAVAKKLPREHVEPGAARYFTLLLRFDGIA